MKFIRRQKVVEAMYFDGSETSAMEIYEWSRHNVKVIMRVDDQPTLSMKTKYGPAETGGASWVILGSCGLYYPCSKKDFDENYSKHPEPETMLSFPEVRRLLEILNTPRSITNPNIKDGDTAILDKLEMKVGFVENGFGGYSTLQRL